MDIKCSRKGLSTILFRVTVFAHDKLNYSKTTLGELQWEKRLDLTSPAHREAFCDYCGVANSKTVGNMKLSSRLEVLP